MKNSKGIYIPNRQAGFIQPGISLMNKSQPLPSGDPYWSNVWSLLYFDGTNGSTTITDEVSGVSWTAGSGSLISTSQTLFGHPTLQTGSGGISTVANLPALGIQDFTFESFVYTTSSTAVQVMSKILPAWPNYVIYNNNVQFSNGSAWIYGTGVTIATNKFVHYAVCRAANTAYLFVNGSLVGTGSITATALAGKYMVGADQSGNYVRGYVAQARLTVGKARYTSSFTPPTAAFPNHA